MGSAIQIGHGRLGVRGGRAWWGGGGIWSLLIFVSVADGMSGECYSSRSQGVYYEVLFKSIAGSIILWSVIQVGRGEYNIMECVIRVGRGEYNIMECVIRVGRGDIILWSVLFESVAGSTVLWSVVQVGHGGGRGGGGGGGSILYMDSVIQVGGG